MGEYDDLIYLPHPVSRKHPPMSAMDRAAQFSPFSALTGYEAVLQEAPLGGSMKLRSLKRTFSPNAFFTC